MTKKYKEKELFDLVAKLPEELSLKEVQTQISGIADGSITATTNSSWYNYFTFKTIIMTSTSVVIAALSLMYFIGPNQSTNANDLIAYENGQELIKTNDPDTDSKENIPSLEKLNDTNSEKLDNPKTISFSSLEPMNIELLPPVPSNITVKTESLKITTNPKKTEERTEDIGNTEVSDKPISTTRTYPIGNKYPEIVPELSGIEMRKYKNTLLKNLFKDGLILSKKDYVQMLLHENEIILNKKKLNDDQFLKYRKITSRIGYGPQREIRINTEYILLGDFTEEGFIGSGRGRFEEQLIDKEGESILSAPKNGEGKLTFEIGKDKDRQEQQEKDEKELDLFSIQHAAIYDASKQIKSLFGVNLSFKNTSILHKQLYDLLIRDGIIENRKSLALLEISEANIYINGVEQSATLSAEFYKLLKKYKITPHPNRQIRLSEFILKVGDFQSGKFKGSITLLYD